MRMIEPSTRDVPQSLLPKHVGIIMDGNGRWASYRGLERTEGHYAAWKAVLSCIKAALMHRIEFLTLYAFSPENWNRPRRDIDELFNIHKWKVGQREFDRFAASGVRFLVCGDRTEPRLPAPVLTWLGDLESRSSGGDVLTVCIALNHGGRQEIVQAANRAFALGAPIESVEEFHRGLEHPHVPDIDLAIRTGGEQRISNFQIWRLSYAELVFTDTLFPDFTEGHFASALNEFASRQRRFGGVSR